MIQPSDPDQEQPHWVGRVLAVIRWTSWLFLGLMLLVGVSGVVGGMVTIVVGVARTDGGSIASGFVGLLLGGASLAAAHGFWGVVHPRQASET